MKNTLTYQQSIQVEIDERLLENESRSLDEISYQAGYDGSSTFRYIFSEQTGLVPTKYQKIFQLGIAEYHLKQMNSNPIVHAYDITNMEILWAGVINNTEFLMYEKKCHAAVHDRL